MTSPSSYPYTSLDIGEIRVFRMNNDKGDQIEGNLIKIDISPEPNFFNLYNYLTIFQPVYEALSYHWGDRKSTRPIIIDGHRVEIQANLHDALKVLRQKCRGVPIWADAICINQTDEVEKLSQIRLMGKIYQTARKVWAFIGKAPEGMEEAMPLLPTLCRHAKELQRPLMGKIRQFENRKPVKMLDLGDVELQTFGDLPSKDSSFWSTIYNLVYSEYFNRLWILQEVAFAKKVDFLCGDYKITWDQMELLFGAGVQRVVGFRAPPPFPPLIRNAAVFETRKRFRNENFSFAQRLLLAIVQGFVGWMLPFFDKRVDRGDPEMQTMMQPMDDIVWYFRALNLEDLLESAVAQKCSEPGDRIFAILGLLKVRAGRSGFPWTDEQSAEEMFIEAFYYLSRKDASLQILTLAGSEPTENLSLPSWCPNLHGSRGWQSGDTRRIQTANRAWQASSHTQTIGRGSDCRRLKLEGVRVSSVDIVPGSWKALNLGDCSQKLSDLEAKTLANLEWLHRCLGHALVDADNKSIDEVFQQFWRTIIVDQREMIMDRDIEGADFVNLMRLMERAISEESSWEREQARVNAEVRGSPGLVARELRLIALLDSDVTRKVFFKTGNGMLGITYPRVQTGDTVCVFEGAKMPHIIRRRDSDSWTFVGEAYVHGLMHGEAEYSVDGEKRKSETFVLL